MRYRVTSYGEFSIEIPNEDAKLVALLMQAVRIESKYEDGVTTYKPATDNKGNPIFVEVSLMQELSTPTPALDAALNAVKVAETRWLEDYHRANKAEKELKELKAKIDSMTSTKAEA